MKFFVEYPIHEDADGGAWLDPDNIIEFARVAEASGVDGLGLTDHPAPSKKWLERGGHETIEPFVGLGFFAAATTRVRLMTQLVVVPYRNPLFLAKEMTTVDVLSKGRGTFVMGTGYLRSEFAALGVDFHERNDLFDEAVAVMKAFWATDELNHEGKHFTALGATLKPGPVQKPHPPLWLGGNAAVVRERVAQWGDGWAPMMSPPGLANTARTVTMSTLEDLQVALDDLSARLEKHGRSLSDIDISTGGAARLSDGVDAYLESLGRLSGMGVTWTGAPIDRSSVAAALDSLRRFGEEVAPKASDI